ncbi:MAG: glutamyl-tRNA reductase [Kiloniellales bacterium]|nr:glutamyl-tRNA reductase [Kiloniellales bacterium]MDJ0981828.1 glutamyl-tRNA reductase [Kiloniellales bacterium]
MESQKENDALIFGVNQRTAGPLLRQRLLEVDGDAARRLADLRAAGLTQAVLLDTCERVDVVAAASEAEVLRERLPDLLAAWGQVEAREVAEQAYLLEGAAAVRHLFAVASSLDSEILGEPQVLGQVKESHRAASAAGMTGPYIDRLFEAAYAAAKRVRSETGLAAQPVTIAAAALQVARRIHGDLDGSTALIAGLGEMAEVLGWQLKDAEIGDLVFAHPSEARAGQVARRLACHYRPWEELPEALKDADILVAARGSGRYTITEAMVRAALKRRRWRPIFIIDAAVPGDVEPAVDKLEEAFVYNLDDLERVAQEGRVSRDKASRSAWALIEEELGNFLRTRAERAATPTVAALRDHFEKERRKVLSQSGLDADAATRLLIKRLLHDPSRRLRDAAAAGEASRLEEGLRRLFGLGRGAAEDKAKKEQDEE